MTRVAVVGAGPAGLAAASAALRAGAEVTLLDAAAATGGQYWRHLPPSRPAAREARLHQGWRDFTMLSRAVARHPRATVIAGAQVWAVEPCAFGDRAPTLQYAVGDADGSDRDVRTLSPDALVLATGAHDLTLPFPGWDLPGVFTGGAAQALAKSERVAVGERVVVAGAGPFLLPVAASLLSAGAEVAGVFEASPAGTLAAGWASGAASVAAMPHKLGELAGYVVGQLRGRVPYRAGAGVIAAHGIDRVEAVTVAALDADWRPIPGTERVIACDAVAVSHGFTPRLELAIAAGCALADDFDKLNPAGLDGLDPAHFDGLNPAGLDRLNPAEPAAPRPWSRFVAVDDDQRTSVPRVFAAGEVTGIAGADAALREGGLAGWLAAGGDPGDRRVAAARRRIARYRGFARALDAAHGIRPGWTDWLTRETTVCRCEELSYGRLTDVLEATGSRSIRALKLATRAGLGPCQGRICGRTVESIAAARNGAPLDGVVIDRRPIAAPIRFSELARLPHPEERHEP
ncbi:FAD/NAD(P)-dependent oxidoreductase [Gryllotalpicola ginsengisoli]|uniref:FAD/NAD(P)-dependent oxidoreductase n=1 Tax=Gryllotalpicola ginsengisoli TaxID=444608 RepID=UPI0003B714CD|nr:NAD(P)/FAD-dependent oxidoreductase [Gryllotalpicola ginsengisoli]